MNQQKDNRAGDRGVGDIECPESVELVKGQIDIRNIDIDKIDNLAKAYPVDQIPHRSPQNAGQWPGGGVVGAVFPEVVSQKRENRQCDNRVVGGRAELCAHRATFVVDQRKADRGTNDVYRWAIGQRPHRPDFGDLIENCDQRDGDDRYDNMPASAIVQTFCPLRPICKRYTNGRAGLPQGARRRSSCRRSGRDHTSRL